MKIKETPWERENLGVESSAVFFIEEDDTRAVLDQEIANNRKYQYLEAVVPTSRVDLLNALLESGFRFAELAIQQSTKTSYALPKIYERHARDFSFQLAKEDEIKDIYGAILQGSVFTTDKISLNPQFGPCVAARRYYNWISKEINEQKAYAYIIRCKEKNIGFTVLKKENNSVCDGMLSGLLSPDAFAGYGVYLGYSIIQAAASMGAKVLKAHVSSNNMPVIRANQMLGYQIESMLYVLTKNSK